MYIGIINGEAGTGSVKSRIVLCICQNFKYVVLQLQTIFMFKYIIRFGVHFTQKTFNGV